MKELLLAILIACSLGLGGCTEQPESTGNKQLDNALGIKTEEKVKEPKKIESNKKEEVKKSDTREKNKTEEKKANNSKKSDKNVPDPQSEEEIVKRVNARDIVIGKCDNCSRTIRKSEVGYDTADLLLCKDCYNKGYVNCMDCGKRINYHSDETYSGSDGTRCKECERKYEEKTSTEYCNKCGKKMKIANTSEYTYDDNGNIICLDCYFAENDQIGDSEFAD